MPCCVVMLTWSVASPKPAHRKRRAAVLVDGIYVHVLLFYEPLR